MAIPWWFHIDMKKSTKSYKTAKEQGGGVTLARVTPIAPAKKNSKRDLKDLRSLGSQPGEQSHDWNVCYGGTRGAMFLGKTFSEWPAPLLRKYYRHTWKTICVSFVYYIGCPPVY